MISQVPPQAQALMGNYQQLRGESQKEQWARNLARQAGISDSELNQMIGQARTQLQAQPAGGQNASGLPQIPQMNPMNLMTQQILGKLMGGFRL